jgi:hypothetical protein
VGVIAESVIVSVLDGLGAARSNQDAIVPVLMSV